MGILFNEIFLGNLFEDWSVCTETPELLKGVAKVVDGSCVKRCGTSLHQDFRHTA